MFCKQMENILFICFWFTCLQALGYSDNSLKTTQDMPSMRTNTLSDDADDIQKQLDNEARDRIKFGRPQTIWILHYSPKNREATELATTEAIRPRRDYYAPIRKSSHKTHRIECAKRIKELCPEVSESGPKECWNYKNQLKWYLWHPSCSGSNQSPINLPFYGLLHIKASRQMLFSQYNIKPKSMTLVHDGETVSLFGDWGSDLPFVYGGAAHSRRYVFHSLSIRWPSEHTVGGFYFPMESQAIHVSVEYANLKEALQAASKDNSALLVVANIYKHSDKNHQGLEELVQAITSTNQEKIDLTPLPLNVFSPPLKEYAAYHGSLTIPPCTETVLWLVRARTLPITRTLVDVLENANHKNPGQNFIRLVQPLNDRKVYYFN